MSDVNGGHIPIGQARRLWHSPRIINGRPADLQPIPVIDPITWHNKPVPERKWLVPDLIPERNVTMLAGDGGQGKTLLAIQLLVACALGKPWLGIPARPCKVAGFFCEDDEDELHRRIADVLRYYDADFGDLENLTLISRAGADNLLIRFPDQWAGGETTPLYIQIETLVRDIAGAELLVLDSLHDLFGGNENARPHARQFISELRGLAISMENRGAVVLTAHPSLSGRNSGTGEAGSTAWNNAVRSRLYLTTPKGDGPGTTNDHDARELSTMKANYGPRGGAISLHWRDGVFVRDDEPGGILGAIKKRAAETVFLELLAAVTAEGRFVSEMNRSGNYAPRLFASRPDRQGYRTADFERAMESLFVAKKISVSEYGRPGDRRHKIAATEPLREEPL